LFRPLARRLGGKGGLLAGFLLSGVVHDVVISFPAGGGYGLPTIYFMLQAGGMIVEQTNRGQRLGLAKGAAGWTFAMVVVALPAPLLFHWTFVHEIVLPFLHAIGCM